MSANDEQEEEDDEEQRQHAASAQSKSLTSKSAVDKKKIGHREIKDGVVHYKKVLVTKGAIALLWRNENADCLLLPHAAAAEWLRVGAAPPGVPPAGGLP